MGNRTEDTYVSEEAKLKLCPSTVYHDEEVPSFLFTSGLCSSLTPKFPPNKRSDWRNEGRKDKVERMKDKVEKNGADLAKRCT
jgi:hypothetical protein